MTEATIETPAESTVGIMPWQDCALDTPQRFFDSESMCRALGLDYTVRTAELVNARTSEPCRTFREVYREDTGQTLGIVKPRYHAIQNVDAFSFLPELAGQHGLEVVAGGALEDGAKAWILTKLREVELPNRILPNGERDRIAHHLLFWNSHDGSSSRKIAAVPYAFWCANALATAWHNAEAAFAVRHSRTADFKVANANQQLVEAVKWTDQFEAQMLQLDAERIKRDEVKAIAEQVLTDVHGAIQDAKESLDESGARRLQRSLDRREDKAERIATLFEGEGRSCRGESKLDAYQAITEFIDHHRSRRRTAASRVAKAFMGQGDQNFRAAALARLIN